MVKMRRGRDGVKRRGGGDVTLVSWCFDCTKGSRFAEELTPNL